MLFSGHSGAHLSPGHVLKPCSSITLQGEAWQRVCVYL